MTRQPHEERSRNLPRINSARLIQYRLGLGLSKIDFARLCRVSDKRLAVWESSPGMEVHLATLNKLATGCGCEPRDLMLLENAPQLITTTKELIECNISIVQEAEEFLFVTGSRSRDKEYIAAIEQRLADRPNLIHRRLLFGPPRTDPLREHVLELLKIRDRTDKYVGGFERLAIVLYDSDRAFPPEAAICMNEHRALIVLPSIDGSWSYSTAIVFDQQAVIRGWRTWIESIFNSHKHILRAADVPEVRDPSEHG